MRGPRSFLPVIAWASLILAGCQPGPAVTQAVTEAPTPEATVPMPTEEPTSAPTPEAAPPILSSAVFEDQVNDPIDCQTGAPVDEPMAGYMDIHAIRVEVREASVSWVWVVAPGSNLPAIFAAAPLAGGLGFSNSSQPMPDHDPDWYLNNVANSGFGFIWNRDTRRLDGYDSVFTAEGWGTIEGFVTAISVLGNEIRVTLPWEHIPSGAPWYGSTTNAALCDEIGLVDDLPALEGPQAVEEESAVTY